MNAPLRRVGVIGWPLERSLSPPIHQHWMRKANLREKTYEAIPVPRDELFAFLGRLAGDGFAGCNVTVPHKEAVFSYIESHGTLDANAEYLRAVNLVSIDGSGNMEGRNTDGYGFIESLREHVPNFLPCRKAVVLGAGGSARAILAALRECKTGSIIVVNRTRERAEKLLRELNISNGEVFGIGDIRTAAENANLFVNTTNLGMAGSLGLEQGVGIAPAEFLKGLARDAIVSDIVYTPLRTELLRTAQKQGLAAVDGLGMLIHQAVPSFEVWFGVRPEVTPALRALLEKELHARGNSG
ncbi:MAG: shikimate dehydrogenase [Hyphomicrobiales bacterium]|nr:shikimate dehydrogenase [Hyphomicrobiales bacterium]MCY4054237.1 shikimate dehydrogenase [Hyphomicrobiales bacterium]